MGNRHARLPSTDDDTDASDDSHSSSSDTSRSSRSDGSRSSSDRDTDNDAQDTEDDDVEETPRRHSRRHSMLLVILLLLLLCGALALAGWFWWTKSGTASASADAPSTVTATASSAATGGGGGADDGETGQTAAGGQATGGAGESGPTTLLPTQPGTNKGHTPSNNGSQPSASAPKTSTSAGSSASPTKAASTKLKTCKKGTGYNDAPLTLQLNLCWAYNWAAAPGGTLGDGVMYVPMLWGSSDQYTKDWDKNARAAISAGATHVFGFNEPDLDTQSNISPQDAAKAWQTYIQPLAGSAKLVSPAVTNGVKAASGAPMGVAWLKEFVAACDGCTIDAFALHWYDAASNTAYFTSYLEQAYKNLSKPIWLTEFMGTGSATDQATFLKFADPWLEQQTFIEKYAAFGDFASNPVAVFVDKDGTPNDLGKVYAGS